jgi:two-component system LytT family response regulator
MMKAIIVDDEVLGRENVHALLTSEADIQIVAECKNGREAVEAIRKHHPDIVFLDIQMPRMDGFGVIAELAPGPIPQIIFVTAHDQYAIQAFEVSALDYLLKPLNRERFGVALEKARHVQASHVDESFQARLLSLIETVEARRPRLERFPVHQGSQVSFVRIAEIEAVEATGNWMHLYVGKQSHMIRDSLQNLEERLDPSTFMRVHRSWLVNVNCIEKVVYEGGGVGYMRLHGGREVPVSRGYREALDRWVARQET